MALDYVPLTMPLVAGVDTKHDQRSLPAPALGDLENAVFDKIGGLQKCPGRTAVDLTQYGATLESGGARVPITDLKGVMAYRDELLIVTDNDLYSRAPNAGKSDVGVGWPLGVVNRGPFESVRTEYRTINALANTAFADRAENDSIELYAWAQSGSPVAYRCIDQATGVMLNRRLATETWADSVVATSSTTPKCRAVGARLHLYYVDSTPSPRRLMLIVIDPANVNSTIESTAIALATDVQNGSQYDVDVDTANATAYVAYRNNTGTGEYTVLRVTETGTIATTAVKARACLGPIACSYNSAADQLLIARMATGTDVRSDWLAASTLGDGTVNVQVTTNAAQRITCVARAANSGYVFWDTLDSGSFMRVKRATITTTLGAVKVLVRHSRIASRARISDDARTLLHVVYSSGRLQQQFVLLDADMAVGNPGQDAGPGTQSAGDEVGLLARLFPGEAYTDGDTTGHIAQIERTALDQYKIALLYQRRAADLDSIRSTEHMLEPGIRDVHYTFGDARSYDGVELGQAYYCPGGYLATYDGRRMAEAGFWSYPPVTAADMTSVSSSGGGLTATESHSYRFYWEAYNDQGERIRSTFAGAVTKSVSADHNSFDVVVRCNPYTRKERIILAVYRTEGNAVTGAPFYRCSHSLTGNSFKLNDVNADTITWQDREYNDTQLLANELDPSNTGELDNVPPAAPPLVLARGQNRLFYVHPENRNEVHYSKLRDDGDQVAFNESLVIAVPEAGGRVIAVAPAEDSVLILKESAIYLAPGTGPDNLGAGDYDAPRLVSADVGCNEARSVARLPTGIMFRGEKGFYLVDGAYNVRFIGAQVEDYNSRTITGVLPYVAEHRAVVLSSDAAGSYAYDYLVNQWSDWPTLPSIVDGVLSQDLAYYLEPSNRVSQETPAAWTNLTPAAYSLAVDTGWIKLADLQGFARARWFEWLGEWRGSAAFRFRIRVAYEYNDTWVDDETFAPASSMETLGNPVRIRGRFTRPKASAVRLRIEDVQGSGGANWGEGVRWTGLALSVALKGGLARLPANQTA